MVTTASIEHCLVGKPDNNCIVEHVNPNEGKEVCCSSICLLVCYSNLATVQVLIKTMLVSAKVPCSIGEIDVMKETPRESQAVYPLPP